VIAITTIAVAATVLGVDSRPNDWNQTASGAANTASPTI